jgi:hypothetical protein
MKKQQSKDRSTKRAINRMNKFIKNLHDKIYYKCLNDITECIANNYDYRKGYGVSNLDHEIFDLVSFYVDGADILFRAELDYAATSKTDLYKVIDQEKVRKHFKSIKNNMRNDVNFHICLLVLNDLYHLTKEQINTHIKLGDDIENPEEVVNEIIQKIKL